MSGGLTLAYGSIILYLIELERALQPFAANVSYLILPVVTNLHTPIPLPKLRSEAPRILDYKCTQTTAPNP